MQKIDIGGYALAKGADIYKAAVEGAEQGFNRSTDDYSIYEMMLSEVYEYQLSETTSEEQDEIRSNTNNDWRQAYLPICFLLEHNHIGGRVSEPHARVMLETPTPRVIDIPMQSWLRIRSRSRWLMDADI